MPNPFLSKDTIEAAADFISKQEGFRSTVYDDGGKRAIGYGFHIDHMPMSFVQYLNSKQGVLDKTAANSMLRWYITDIAKNISSDLGDVADGLSQDQAVALLSLQFNTGPSGASDSLAYIKNGDIVGAANNMMKIIHDGKKVLPSLIKRRRDEVQLLLNNNNTDIVSVMTPKQDTTQEDLRFNNLYDLYKGK